MITDIDSGLEPLFKVPELFEWLVVSTGSKFMCKAPENIVSILADEVGLLVLMYIKF